MLTILYSFNKKGYEAEYWQREIAGSSDDQFCFIPFNHDPYLDIELYVRAQLLDNLYYERHPGLFRLYSDFQSVIQKFEVAAVIVDNCPPYHPDYLRNLQIFKVLRIADGPISAYDRDFAYLHAYDMVLYHSPAYSADMGMAEKLRYCGANNIHFWPLGVFDAMHDPIQNENTILKNKRDIDIIFIGTMHIGKMPFLAKIKKAFKRNCRIHGLTSWKRNLYFNFKYGLPGWIIPLSGNAYVPLYQRSKIGINVHNRGDYSVGNYRLFDLPANGVMQISDGGEYLNEFFRVGEEIVTYKDADDLIDKLHYYLAHDKERRQIALSGYRRAMCDHRIKYRMYQMGKMIQEGITGVHRK
jgi:hypothetical protein